MTALPIANTPAPTGWTVDPNRGGRNTRVASEWFSRPADERYLSLDSLAEAVARRARHSHARVVDVSDLRIAPARGAANTLTLEVPGEPPLNPTHWSFGQLASLAGAPAGWLRQLPAPLAALNLEHGLSRASGGAIQLYASDEGRHDLRAATGPEYGRILDHDLVQAVQRFAGNGTGDTRWKVPGVLDWKTRCYDPLAPVSTDSTTLYASDRDVFVFLVDDLNPIEVGKLPNGEPDVYFRGFYCWNSEVGAKTLGIASFYLRAVCQNRTLWGVEDFREVTLRHSKNAASRFVSEVAPALTRFVDASPRPFVDHMHAARQRVLARTPEDRTEVLRTRGFSRTDTNRILDAVIDEEGHPASTAWDFVQGITALARERPHQDARLDLEAKARTLLLGVR
jgi:hypothetical protein